MTQEIFLQDVYIPCVERTFSMLKIFSPIIITRYPHEITQKSQSSFLRKKWQLLHMPGARHRLSGDIMMLPKWVGLPPFPPYFPTLIPLPTSAKPKRWEGKSCQCDSPPLSKRLSITTWFTVIIALTEIYFCSHRFNRVCQFLLPFLAVQDSSIDDLVTESVSQSVRDFWY